MDFWFFVITTPRIIGIQLTTGSSNHILKQIRFSYRDKLPCFQWTDIVHLKDGSHSGSHPFVGVMIGIQLTQI
jgi:hypothetical protein